MHFCTSFTLVQIISNFVELLFVYIFREITTENFRYSSQKQSKYFLFFPKDKKHSKTFHPLFRSNYVGSWCNLNSPFLQSIRVDLKKVSDKMPWLIIDLIFFFFYVSEWSEYEAHKEQNPLKMDLLLIKLFLLLAVFTAQVEPHGRLIEPPSRSTMWR